jgi:pimeloyl-ACP methyl ester carboxylesterase
MALCLLVTFVFPASGCARPDAAVAKTVTVPTGTPLKGDYTPSGVGGLDAANDLPGIDPRLAEVSSMAARFTYTTRSGIDDSAQQATGVVFAPKGDPPAGGWPMLAFGHPATGVLAECGPSLSSTLLGSSAVVADLVAGGYVVTVPDYLGLGTDSPQAHPFLDSTSSGYNLIDSMSAIRKLVPNTSANWFAVGIGQGGQAAWSANELMDNHGMGLNLLGAVSISPVADLEELVDLANTGQLNPGQKLLLVSILDSLSKTYGDAFNLDDFRRGSAIDHWDVLLACGAPSDEQHASVADLVANDDLRPGSPEAAKTLRGFLQKVTLPQGPTQVPMLVTYGGRDRLIPKNWTAGALKRACAMGDVIQIQYDPDTTGTELDTSAVRAWMGDRLHKIPPINDCASSRDQ